MPRLWTIITAAAVLVAATGCKEEETGVMKHGTNPEEVPTMSSRDVITVISDNGHTRYRITTPLWNMYEECKDPHWVFPKGIKAEEMDQQFNVTTTIQCDSAYYDQMKQLWDLHGNVNIKTSTNDLIMTDQMFWNQVEHKLYSDAFIHVEKGGRIIEGHGYESNEQFSTYTLRKVEATFPIDQSKMPHPGSGSGGGSSAVSTQPQQDVTATPQRQPAPSTTPSQPATAPQPTRPAATPAAAPQHQSQSAPASAQNPGPQQQATPSRPK